MSLPSSMYCIRLCLQCSNIIFNNTTSFSPLEIVTSWGLAHCAAITPKVAENFCFWIPFIKLVQLTQFMFNCGNNQRVEIALKFRRRCNLSTNENTHFCSWQNTSIVAWMQLEFAGHVLGVVGVLHIMYLVSVKATVIILSIKMHPTNVGGGKRVILI